MASMGDTRLHIGEVKAGEPVWVQSLIIHPMETGLREDSRTGETIPAHYIQKVKADYNGERVFEADWSIAVSKNPYLGFYLQPGEGGTLEITWEDNRGEVFTARTRVDPEPSG